MAEKCFCHLNGYKVKDADARKTLEEHNERIEKIGRRTTNVEQEILAINVEFSNLEERQLNVEEEFGVLERTVNGYENDLVAAVNTAESALTKTNAVTGTLATYDVRITGLNQRVSAIENSGGTGGSGGSGLTLYRHEFIYSGYNLEGGALIYLIINVISTYSQEVTVYGDTIKVINGSLGLPLYKIGQSQTSANFGTLTGSIPILRFNQSGPDTMTLITIDTSGEIRINSGLSFVKAKISGYSL